MLHFKGKASQNLVPAAGLEPARPIKPRDFKSLVSTIPPRRQVIRSLFSLHFNFTNLSFAYKNCLLFVYLIETRDYA